MSFADVAENFPVTLELRFRSEDEKADFLGQLSDGWGENFVGLEWDHPAVPLDKAPVVLVEVFEELDEEE